MLVLALSAGSLHRFPLNSSLRRVFFRSPFHKAPLRKKTGQCAHLSPSLAPAPATCKQRFPSLLPGLVRKSAPDPIDIVSRLSLLVPGFARVGNFASPKSKILAFPRRVTKM